MELPINQIIKGHVLDIIKHFPNNSIDVVVTSPPYLWLRTYGEKAKVQWSDGWYGELGLEPYPQMFINHLTEIFREVKRILKPTGSFWLNMGDIYCGQKQFDNKWLRPKQKLMIPERIAIALQDDGWILRNTIIWYKKNHMPSSVKDRLTNVYEYVFFFVKNPKYYFNLDAIREPLSEATIKRGLYPSSLLGSFVDRRPSLSGKHIDLSERYKRMREEAEFKGYTTHSSSRLITGLNVKKPEEKQHMLGKNPGDVWEMNVQPFNNYWCNNCKRMVLIKNGLCRICGLKATAHFAVYPEQLVERILKCSCPSNGVVLDPFIGSGTTAIVAKKLGLNYIGIDINEVYVEMAKWRIAQVPEKIEKWLFK